ncbi:MAG: efflux RND transporter periplasmic adaptor subunit [Candidatus Rokuibacteriota bacterium]
MAEGDRRLAAVLVVLVILAAGCGREEAGVPAAKAAAAPEGLTVTAVPVQARDVERVVETTGSLLAWEEATVSTSVPGTIARLAVDLGDRVRAGQVVAELETREFTLGVQQAEAALRAARDTLTRAHAQVDAARANLQQVRDSRKSWEANVKRWKVALEEAHLNLERSRTLVEGEFIAKRELDAARTQYESVAAQYESAQVDLGQYPERVRAAEAQLRSDLSAVRVAEAEIARREAELGMAEKRLGDATLRTPIGGAVARRHVNPGEYVKENVAVFSIVRSDSLKYSGVVSEHAALEIRAGQAVRLEVDPVPGRTFTGRVTRVSPAVDVASRTVLLEAQVPNPDALLKPGLFARGVLATRRDASIPFVSEAAVTTFAGITKVFVLVGGKAQERSVKLGRKQDGMVEILEGVRPGEQVATSSLAQLYDGAGVTVQARSRGKP